MVIFQESMLEIQHLPILHYLKITVDELVSSKKITHYYPTANPDSLFLLFISLEGRLVILYRS